jgi:hypothetical protein
MLCYVFTPGTNEACYRFDGVVGALLNGLAGNQQMQGTSCGLGYSRPDVKVQKA